MDPIEKLLPIVMLGVLTAILLVLVRRAAHDKPAVRMPGAAPTPVAGEFGRIEAPAPVAVAENRIEVNDQEALAVPKIERQPKRKQPVPLPVPAAPTSTIDATLELLRDPQSLAAAFVLREVFAPPVSRQPRLPHER